MASPLLLLGLLSLGAAGQGDVAPPLFDAQGRALQPLSQRVVDYHIHATLDPQAHVLHGQEQVTWKNRSNVPQSTLWFHAYWNAFKNERSTFFKDNFTQGGSRDVSAEPKVKDSEWGAMTLTQASVVGGGASQASVLSTLKYQHPDDDNTEDQTVFTLQLPTPVAPGGSVTLDISWDGKVPKTFARAGRSHDYYFFGQWFPKLAVLEVPPERGVTAPRWNAHQYHANTEFYADYGTFDVEMTVPQRFVVGAVGVRVESHSNADGTRTDHYHQDDVHDFSWTAWPDFIVAEDTFHEEGLPEIRLTVLAPVHQEAAAQQAIDATKFTLREYGRKYWPFPYPHVTVVLPPAGASPSAGMEYPTLITAVSRRSVQEPRDYLLWTVISHELGHNYFYGLLGSNEFEESWLDEGITSYVCQQVDMAAGVRLDLSATLPPALRALTGNIFETSFTPDELDMSAAPQRIDTAMVVNGWDYQSHDDYSFNSYTRPQLMLQTLQQKLGDETMSKVMRTYVERFKFKHPTTRDFFATASEVSGRDLSGFEASFISRPDTLDFAVAAIECNENDPEHLRGYFDAPDGGAPVLHKAGPEATDAAAKGRALHHCEVTVERRGQLVEPVDVRVTFADGKDELLHWDGVAAWHRFTFERTGKGGKVTSARLVNWDKQYLDANHLNDGRNAKPDLGAPLALSGWLTYFFQLAGSAASTLF